MKIFVDTANINDIKKIVDLGFLDGVTTNPTLIAKEKNNFEQHIKEITKVFNGPLCVEVISNHQNEMIEEAKKLSRIAPNIIVKIPMTEEGLKTVKELNKVNIKTNMTLIFSANQALLAAKVGANYVSPFIGRLDDVSNDGMTLIKEIITIFKNYGFKTEVIVASIRHPLHVIEAAKIGAHIATIPPEIINKMIKHPLTDIGIKRFLDDWGKYSSQIS